MAKTQELQTLGDYRKAARESLFGLDLSPEIESTSPYDAITTALIHSKHLIDFSRTNTSETERWARVYFSRTQPVIINIELFYSIKLMEFAITYEQVQSIDELLPNWPKRPDANIRVFTSPGLSFLEAAFGFVLSLGSSIILILEDAYGEYRKQGNSFDWDPFKFLRENPKVDDLEINPKPDIIIKTWFDNIVKGMQSIFTESDFSEVTMEAEFNSIHRQLEYERNNQTPKNLMTSSLLVEHFKVSPQTLRRYVKKKKLTDYREKPHSKNAKLILDAVEVARWFDRRS
jgi:hypothetical protein